MKWNIYSIKDTAAGIFQRPIVARTDGEVRREFANLCVNKKHPVGQHPGDYDLYKIGQFDDVTGVVNASSQDRMSIGREVAAFEADKAGDAEALARAVNKAMQDEQEELPTSFLPPN